MPPPADAREELGALERVREGLYAPKPLPAPPRSPLVRAREVLPRVWKGSGPPAPPLSREHSRLASRFLMGAGAFFFISLAIAGYFLYFGGNSVSVNHIDLAVEGPSTIAAGDTVPLLLTITNRNPVAIEDATVEITFPEGTRKADDVLIPMLVYSENLGTLASGETVTRSIRVVVFGSAGSTLTLPISLSYGASGSSATFVKKDAYPLAISSTPLSASVDTVAESVAGKPFTITVQARSNATVPIDHVIVAGTFPFGFSLTSSSIPAVAGSNFVLGTMAPGESKTITLSGSLDGQNGEDKVFHFSIGVGKDANASTPAVSYMTQEARVAITAPFIETALTLNGAPLASATIAPGKQQQVTVSYTNNLSTSLTNATVAVTLSGAAVDYASIRSTNGFYRSSDHTILFSRDTGPGLSSLAPGARGVGSFTFMTAPSATFGRAPSVTFTTSVSGTRVGQSNVPAEVSASLVQTVKATTAIVLSAASTYKSGPLTNSGPIPPKVDSTTSYTVTWSLVDTGSAVANGVVSATLPSYITYTGAKSGQGAIVFDSKSRTVTWSAGDLPAGASSKASFQVALKPSTSQKGVAPALTGTATFSGYDRFAGAAITATVDPVTTETTSDSGYNPGNATVQ